MLPAKTLPRQLYSRPADNADGWGYSSRVVARALGRSTRVARDHSIHRSKMASILEVAYFRVQGLSVPVLTLPDRRLPEPRRTRWCFLRDMEAVLYGNANSTGAMHRLLARESL